MTIHSAPSPDPHAARPCELCDSDGGLMVWQEPDWRVIRVDDAAFPGFYRLVHRRHVAEFSQLEAGARQRCMQLLAWVEGLAIRHLQPTKMNLASLGNLVPHLHWHLVARFDWDSHFPHPIWAAAQRDAPPGPLQRVRAALAGLDTALAAGPP